MTTMSLECRRFSSHFERGYLSYLWCYAYLLSSGTLSYIAISYFVHNEGERLHSNEVNVDYIIVIECLPSLMSTIDAN